MTEWLVHPGYVPDRIAEDGPHAVLSDRINSEFPRIMITRRTLSEIDRTLDKTLIDTVRRMVRRKKEGESVQILDVGSGWEASGARSLALMFGEDVNVSVLDVVLRDPPVDPRVTQFLGDSSNMPIPDASQHLVYSTYSLFTRPFPQLLMTFSEVVRVLKPGGRALLHDAVFRWYENQSDEMKELRATLGIGAYNRNISGYGPTLTLIKPE